jgi:hypothetical protein
MEDIDELKIVVRDWIKIESELKILNAEVKRRKNEKKKKTMDLMNVMRKREVDCLEMKDGRIEYERRTIKKGITQKELLEILKTYYRDDERKAEELNEVIQKGRKEVIKEDIKYRKNP